MLDVWSLKDDGTDRVESLPFGRKGTVVEWEPRQNYLPCGCCSEPAPANVTVRWDDKPNEDDYVSAEDLRELKED